MDNLLTRLVELEAEVKYKTPPAPGEMDFRYTPGKLPIMISAPHGAAHRRNGHYKEEDEYTSGLARLLAERTGAHVLYLWRQSESDPNFDADAPYKQALKEILQTGKIKFVLDLHGCAPDREFGVALGSMHGESCPAQLLAILEVFTRSGYHPQGRGLFRLDLDSAFPGGGGPKQETITRYTSKVLGVPALQVELNARLRIARRRPDASGTSRVSHDPEHIIRIIATLEAVVLAVARSDGRAQPGQGLE